jgi:hypothetical protein
MPRATAAPVVLAVGLTLLAAGIPLGVGFLVVGAVVIVAGLGIWVGQLLPGKGHAHVPLPALAQRPQPVPGTPGRVARLEEGMPGYRFRLPTAVHPISAGIKGGILGGVVMPIPALLWGILSGHGPWYPVNLLAGMVLPNLDLKKLEDPQVSLFLAALGIHAILSVTLGLIYGVLLPTLPSVPRVIAWGGLLAPLLWTGTSYTVMGLVNPSVQQGVSWPWFIASQFVFGIVSAAVILRSDNLRPVQAGLLGGIVGGLLMPLPAFLWGLLSGHGPWYPVNLLAGMIQPELRDRPLADLEQFNPGWLAAALPIHALLSVGFSVLLGVIHRKLPPIPAPVCWGGLVLPLLWTGTSYGLMGVINPVLQQRVDWAWFVVSQFVFGIAAAVVVLRSELVHIPPAGPGIAPGVQGEGEQP